MKPPKPPPAIIRRKRRRLPDTCPQKEPKPPGGKPWQKKSDPPLPRLPEFDVMRAARRVLREAGMLSERNGVEYVAGLYRQAETQDILRAANKLLKSEGKPLLGRNHSEWMNR